ncbi:hypothetical protein I4F81_002116 [Pyropia yezoensis]|uniref:Uncharacterized protein n=1 Tax=Pyropia yezoensis TaxID=2788 RepID=A0ACC3BPV3_PYRYE|nr:hypothetical protein I4F81_002116 [Neopyropia yezoensis]
MASTRWEAGDETGGDTPRHHPPGWWWHRPSPVTPRGGRPLPSPRPGGRAAAEYKSPSRRQSLFPNRRIIQPPTHTRAPRSPTSRPADSACRALGTGNLSLPLCHSLAMARLACVVAAAAVAVATASTVTAATTFEVGSSRAFFHRHPVVYKKPVAVHKPVAIQGKGEAVESALPVVILPAESALPVVILPAESALPVVVLPAESALPVVVLTATPSAKAKPVRSHVATASPRPTACVPAIRNGVTCPCANGRLNCAAATAAPSAAPAGSPVATASPRPTACVPAMRNGVTCPCANGRLNCAAATAAPSAAPSPRPTACVPAVRNGVLCPCANGRLNCAAAGKGPGTVGVDKVEVIGGGGGKGPAAIMTAVPRPTACVPAVRNGVLCPCANGRLNCAAATAAPSTPPTPRPTACVPAVRNGVTCPCANGRLNCAAATAAPAAAPATATASTSPTPVVVVATSPPAASTTPTASATPVSTVVVVTPVPSVCKVCDGAKAVVTHVPCIKYEKKQVYGCGAIHAFFPVATVVPTAAPVKGCVRWVTVAIKTTCPKTLVKACRHVPCAANAKTL